MKARGIELDFSDMARIRPADLTQIALRTYSRQFAHLDGNCGYVLEVPPVHLGLIGLSTPWYSAHEYREQVAQAANFATIIVLTRDKGG